MSALAKLDNIGDVSKIGDAGRFSDIIDIARLTPTQFTDLRSLVTSSGDIATQTKRLQTFETMSVVKTRLNEIQIKPGVYSDDVVNFSNDLITDMYVKNMDTVPDSINTKASNTAGEVFANDLAKGIDIDIARIKADGAYDAMKNNGSRGNFDLQKQARKAEFEGKLDDSPETSKIKTEVDGFLSRNPKAKDYLIKIGIGLVGITLLCIWYQKPPAETIRELSGDLVEAASSGVGGAVEKIMEMLGDFFWPVIIIVVLCFIGLIAYLLLK